MLLANIAVARQIACGLPEQALLRRHEGPVERRVVGRSPRQTLLTSGRLCQAGEETRVRVRWLLCQEVAGGLCDYQRCRSCALSRIAETKSHAEVRPVTLFSPNSDLQSSILLYRHAGHC